MCGRYTLIKLSDFTDMFPWIRSPDEFPPARYNIAPTQAVAVVPNDGKSQVDFFHWGLIPFWAKDPSIGNKMINARAETLAAKPAFRKALERRRCLIPADGFYEWKRNPDKTKTPMYIRMRSHRPFAFAGLWERWHSPDGSIVPSCTVITGKPNSLVRNIHDRMPVILKPEDYQKWLDPELKDSGELEAMLQPYPAEEMEANPVSTRVNKPTEDSPGCIESMTDPPPVFAEKPKRSKKTKEPEKGLFDL
jgi:putative SOS response-associated peptidase YedK